MMTLLELKIQHAVGTLQRYSNKVGEIKIADYHNHIRTIDIVAFDYAIPSKSGHFTQYRFSEGQILSMGRDEYRRLSFIYDEYSIDTVFLHMYKDAITSEIIQVYPLDRAA